ncbi:hypothetical protein B484DRAFT_67343 [Ochromonadaceae sp. CCMP2298]|nr:hypothetical protein B484DRAFT_67343 [Ochromonadaceae sp. CCMP2298]
MRKEVFRSQKRRGKTTHVRSRVARGGGAGGGGTEGGGTGGGGKGGAGGTGAGGGGATHHRGRLGVRRRFPGRVAVYQISVLLDQLNLISYYNDFKTCSGDGVVGYGSSGRGGGGGVGADVGGCIPYVSKLAVVERPSPFLATPDTCPAVDEPPQNDTGKGTGIAGAKGAGCGGAGAVGAGGAGAEDGGGAGGAGDEFQFAPGELKSVEVNMGALGEFVMKVTLYYKIYLTL